MPIQELYANSTLIVLAGSESTASGLAGITFQLLKHPEALKKAVGEIRSTFTAEDQIEPETVKRLPYLAAIVSEGLRMYPPFPEGLPRTTPRQGALIAGQWVPGGVSYDLQPQSLLIFQFRPMCNSVPTRLIAAQPTSKIRMSSSLSAGWATRSSRLITKKLPNPSLSVHVVVLAESESYDLHLFFCQSPIQLDYLFLPPFPAWKAPITENSLAYLEMRLILARMMWGFDMQLSAESQKWDDQASWIQWDKAPLMVKLRLVGKSG